MGWKTRVAVVAATTAIGAMAATGSAFADTSFGANLGPAVTSIDTTTADGNTVTASGTYQVVGTSPGLIDVTAECTATAVGATIAATGVNKCYLVGTDGETFNIGSNALPGAATAVAAPKLSLPLQNYQICYQGEGLLTSSAFVQTQLVCQG